MVQKAVFKDILVAETKNVGGSVFDTKVLIIEVKVSPIYKPLLKVPSNFIKICEKFSLKTAVRLSKDVPESITFNVESLLDSELAPENKRLTCQGHAYCSDVSTIKTNILKELIQIG